MILRGRIEVAQSGPCSCSGKTPRDGGMGVIALALEGLYLPTQRRLVGDAPSEALATQHAQLDLCHVQPTAMLWGVVELQAQMTFSILLASTGAKVWYNDAGRWVLRLSSTTRILSALV